MSYEPLGEMIHRKQSDDKQSADQLAACLPMLSDHLESICSVMGDAVSREIERGTRSEQIARYLAERGPGNLDSLEWAVWCAVIVWLAPTTEGGGP